jgi:hypothetical protein
MTKLTGRINTIKVSAMFHYASEMLLWLALICSWGWVDGWAAQKFSNVRFGGVRRLG